MADAASTQSGRDRVVSAALASVQALGLRGLTLRAVARQAEVSVATVRHHLGSKTELVPALLHDVVKADVAFLEGWQTTLAALQAPRGWRVTLYFELVDDYLRRHLAHATFVAECLLAGDCDSADLASWLNGWEEVFAELVDRREQARQLACFLVDDLFFALALNEVPPLRLLRAAALQRCLDPQASPRGEDASRRFHLLHEQLAPSRSTLDKLAETLSEPRARLRAWAARIAVEEGLEAVSHRSVAAEAKAQPSAVVHHLGNREQLMVAALEGIIVAFRSGLDRSGLDVVPAAKDADRQARQLRDLARATQGVALASLRYASLREHALDMRRRRGENVRPGARFPDGYQVPCVLDRLGAHLGACCFFGALRVAESLPAWMDPVEIAKISYQD